MIKRKIIDGLCLFLVALFAHAAQAAETILVDPGQVGGSAQPFSFSVTVPSTDRIDLVFTDNKTLTFGPGEQQFSLAFLTGQGFAFDGVLLDEFGDEIPGTEFLGTANVSDASLLLAASTVWSGMRFNGGFFGGAYQLVWVPQVNVPLPEVGDTTGNKPPVADPGGPYRGQVGVPVTFDGSASSDPDGTITTYEWDFGDGTKGGSVTQNHTYSEAGSYHVTLTVTDDDDVPNSASTLVELGTASVPPLADAGGPYLGTTDSAINFDGTGSSDTDGSITNWEWDFGDGFKAEGATVQHQYRASGIYPVTLTVTDNTFQTDIDVTTARIAKGNQPPSADAGAPVTGVVGVAVSFDGGASTDPDGSIAQYDWSYGDGTSDIDAGPTPSHTYDTGGIYSVGLTVTDDDGTRASSFTTADIAKSNQPPVADANGPYSGDVGVAVNFDGTGSSDQDGTITTYAWDFGDGETGAGATVGHTYAEAGEYDVVLTVTDDDGGIDEDRTTATIGSGNQPPVADANGPYAGIVGTPVSFDGTGSSDQDGTITTYAWDFGDGSFGSGAQPQHTYAETGVKKVTLTVTDNVGGTDVSVTQAIIGDGIIIPPVADPGGPYRGQVGVPVTFDGSASSDPDGTITSYEWDFGDGTKGGSVTQNHTYTEAGFYHVTLTVTDNNGVPNSASTLVELGTASVPPLADAGGPYTGTPDSVINFDGTGSSDTDGTIASWAWDFGDGSNADGATVQKGYTASGKYPVILTVTDNTFETDIDVTTAQIAKGNLPPLADAGGPYVGTVGAEISFDSTGSSDPNGDIVQIKWDFGDGTDSGPLVPAASKLAAARYRPAATSSESVVHAYDTPGRYFVVLTVTDNDGAVASAATVVDVASSSGGSSSGSGSSSDFPGCSIGSRDTRDPTLLLLALFAVLYLARRRLGFV